MARQQKSPGMPYRLTGMLLFLIILSMPPCAVSLRAMDRETQKPASTTLGGPCEYKDYKGTATITSIRKKEEVRSHGRSSYDPYEVKFSFSPHEEIKEPHGDVEGKEHVLLLTNSWYPGPKFLKKYGISVGNVFDCYLKVITKGTCTPIIFDFPTIDLNDYFEFQR